MDLAAALRGGCNACGEYFGGIVASLDFNRAGARVAVVPQVASRTTAEPANLIIKPKMAIDNAMSCGRCADKDDDRPYTCDV